GLQLCEQGLPVAEEAVRLQSGDANAWLTLTQIRSACGDRPGAVAAAQQALALAPSDAEAWYRYGQALAATGSLPTARAAYIRAADAEPASPWRARAEEALATLR
ncbi:MAG TPA: tetratricopeptide repeat protein, partial [Roseiflexaceae bacterium]|nr:tetratricopeptide repeat protein [Roseiflexaceae bacterium]